jgi:LPXTG-motif cell wall-anchored protein
MTSRPLVRRFLFSATAAAVGLAASGVLLAGPAAAASLPDLRMTATTTPAKASYAVGDEITTVFTVVNAGTATAVDVHINGGDGEGITRAGDPPKDSFDLAPGASHTINWAGTVNADAFACGSAHGAWEVTNDAGEANQADNIARFSIPVPGGKGDLTAKAFVDLKGDYDSTQPGQPGVTITIADTSGQVVATAVTDSAGKIKVAGLPTGDYVVTTVGWLLEGDDPTGPSSSLAGVRDKETTGLILALRPKTATTPPTTSPTSPATGGATATATASPSSSTGGGTLPITGSSSGPTFLAGIAVLVLGAVALIAVRRRRRRFVA